MAPATPSAIDPAAHGRTACRRTAALATAGRRGLRSPGTEAGGGWTDIQLGGLTMSSIVRGRGSRRLAVGAAALLTLAMVPDLGRRPAVTRASAWRPATSRGPRRAAASSWSTTTRGSHRSTPRPATSASSTPTSPSPATTPSSAASTASRSTTSRTRRTRCCPSSFVCPGGQGDVSVFGDLLFMSVEETRGRIDCGTQGAPGAVNLRALPRRAHLRHLRPRQPGAAAGRPDVPRFAHAHDRHRPGRSRQHLHLQLGHGRRSLAPGAGRL